MDRVIRNAKKYLGDDVVILPSTRTNKKYMVMDPTTGGYIHFGDKRYEDFTQHHNLVRQRNYLARSYGIRGDWKKDKYSANNLSREILWR